MKARNMVFICIGLASFLIVFGFYTQRYEAIVFGIVGLCILSYMHMRIIDYSGDTHERQNLREDTQ